MTRVWLWVYLMRRNCSSMFPTKYRDVLGIIVDVNLRNENLREYLEILVEPYPYPVSYRGEYHYRSGATKQELKGAALDKFLLRKQGRHWDGIAVPYVTLADLEGRSLAYFRRAPPSAADACQQRSCRDRCRPD